jgi:nucleoside-diphosphate-sugar epimerase
MTMSASSQGLVVAVTGASGMLGRHLCASFSGRGWEVRALVRSPAAFTDAPPRVTVGRCDLPEAIDESLLDRASALVHCAYATRATDRVEARHVNEEGTLRILDASRRAGIPRFVFISTVAANPDAPNYYARSKHTLERLLDPERDLVVRPGLIISKHGQGLFQQMRDITRRTHLVPLFGGGKQPLQTVHVDDLCEAIARALERGLTGALNVAEPEPVCLAEFMRMLSDRLQVRCLFLPLPFAVVLAAVRVFEALRLPFPLRSESLLAVKGLQQLPVEEDLRRLDMVVRSAERSIADVV